MTIEMHTPGSNVAYEVPVLKTQEYDLDTIFRKKLYMLLPFYIFVFEKNLKEYESNEVRCQELQQVFLEIRTRLEELTVQGNVSEYEKCAILDMSKRVIRSVTAKYQKVQKGLQDGRKEGQLSVYVELIRDELITLPEAARRFFSEFSPSEVSWFCGILEDSFQFHD